MTTKIMAGVLTRFPILKSRPEAMVAAVLAVILCVAIAPSMADVPPLSVEGNRILIGGQPGSLAGNSLFWSNNGWGGEKYYNASTVAWLKNDWNSRLIRAAMGVEDPGGYIQDPVGNKAKVRAVVDAAIANDMYVIIDWHSHHAEQYRDQAVAFFREMAQTYGQNNHVIYEIYNEPLQVSWSGVIKPYAQAVIAAIRAVDPDNLIIVGTPTWSQDVDQAANDRITGFNNIAYTLHFYAGTHGQYLRDKAQTAMDRGIALFVTEWGSVNANGDGGVALSETNAWMEFLRNNYISHANWALNDKAEGASALVPGASGTGGWVSSQLTASGALSKSIIQNWQTPTPPTCNTQTIPATIQAEQFCEMSGVQVENSSDAGAGQNVGYIDSGDWMTYAVTIPSNGTYRVSYRVASQAGGGVIGLEQAGGSPVFGDIPVPSTGGWQNWQTISHIVQLNAGQQRLALSARSGGFNVNWIRIESTGSSSSSSSSSASSTTVQAEDFAVMSGVQTEATSDSGGGNNVGWLDAGDWLSYTNHSINVPQAGRYRVEYRVASLSGGGRLTFEEAGGSPTYGSIAIPSTGGWQNWTTISHEINLNAGVHRFGISVNSGGWNINWWRITRIN
jgi:endoglucanase